MSAKDDEQKFIDDLIDQLGLTAEDGTRIDNGGLNRETNGYMPAAQPPSEP